MLPCCLLLPLNPTAPPHPPPPSPPDESELGRLDSSVKKNGTFIKKLRQLGADNGKQLLTEATKLNLSKVCVFVYVCVCVCGHSMALQQQHQTQSSLNSPRHALPNQIARSVPTPTMPTTAHTHAIICLSTTPPPSSPLPYDTHPQQYVSEAVISLAEAPLKVADIPAVMDMASALHQRYPDFAASLGPTLAKVAVGAGPGSSKGTPGACLREQCVCRL